MKDIYKSYIMDEDYGEGKIIGYFDNCVDARNSVIGKDGWAYKAITLYERGDLEKDEMIKNNYATYDILKQIVDHCEYNECIEAMVCCNDSATMIRVSNIIRSMLRDINIEKIGISSVFQSTVGRLDASFILQNESRIHIVTRSENIRGRRADFTLIDKNISNEFLDEILIPAINHCNSKLQINHFICEL